MFHIRKTPILLLMCCLISTPFFALAANRTVNALFDAAFTALKTPAQEGEETLTYALHTGDSAYVPSVSPEIVPFDCQEQAVTMSVIGRFQSSDEAVVTVNEEGLMTGVTQGIATVTHCAPDMNRVFAIVVSDDTPPELAKNVAYVARREFYKYRRSRLPKYNEYAKWYYGRKNEVGWCGVFTIWCANAAGFNPIKGAEAQAWPEDQVLYLREGQVGNQYDGFFALNRFSGIPRQGYLVIYAEMRNNYRTIHMGIVVDVLNMGGGIYKLTTVEGNMSNTVKSYSFIYDSNKDNHLVGTENGGKLQWNMSEVPKEDRDDDLVQYKQHTNHWSVFGFCQTWL